MGRLLYAGRRCTTYANQGVREATILAIRDAEALIEYEMPAGTTALRVVDVDAQEAIAGSRVHFARGAHQSYWSLPLVWLQAVVDAGQGWIGLPQQGYKQVPEPFVLLQCRQATRDTFTPETQAEWALNHIHKSGGRLDHYNVTHTAKVLFGKQVHADADILAYMAEHYGWEIASRSEKSAGKL